VVVEVMLILLVFLLAIVLVALGAARLRSQARLHRLGAELQALAHGFEAARAEHGRWPTTAEDAGPAVMEAGWDNGPAIGGEYGWRAPVTGRPGMITITAFTPAAPLDITRGDLLAIDRAIDDGDLATGRFRTGFNGWPVYLVGEKP
jgi:hypothetical protein